jgi:PPOX class probable F420-dependent enzyme
MTPVKTVARIPAEGRAILRKKSFANLATLMDDGSPHVTPVWVDLEGEEIVINTAEGRLKPENMRQDPRVAVSIPDPEDPYKALVVRGRVAEMSHEDADEHIDAMAKKYLDEDTYPFREPGEERVKVRIEPERVTLTS